jgi:cytochrome c553
MSYSMSPALRRIAAAAALSLSLVALPTLAQQAGDAAAGATKAATCTACHGLNGNSVNPEWPSIAGQNAAYGREQIAAIKSGKRPNPLMQPIVQTLTDQDIADLAAYYAQQTPTGLEADPSYWKAGEKLYRGGDGPRGIPACLACHGPVGAATRPPATRRCRRNTPSTRSSSSRTMPTTPAMRRTPMARPSPARTR